MNTSNFEWPVDKKPLYSLLSIRLRGLIDGIPHQISNLANASALLGVALLNINWVGFYLMREGRLVLGPFQGKPACIEIEIGKGVCGTAVANDQVMLVKDVHQFPGHIACDSASNSEKIPGWRIQAGFIIVPQCNWQQKKPEPHRHPDTV